VPHCHFPFKDSFPTNNASEPKQKEATLSPPVPKQKQDSRSNLENCDNTDNQSLVTVNHVSFMFTKRMFTAEGTGGPIIKQTKKQTKKPNLFRRLRQSE